MGNGGFSYVPTDEEYREKQARGLWLESYAYTKDPSKWPKTPPVEDYTRDYAKEAVESETEEVRRKEAEIIETQGVYTDAQATAFADRHHREGLESAGVLGSVFGSMNTTFLDCLWSTSADGQFFSEWDKSQAETRRLTSLVLENVNIAPAGIQSGEVKIGMVKLTVPPTNIQISESRNTQSITGLRTNTEALVRSGRGIIEIGMTLRFPDVNAINNELRPLIAQFRTAPFITVTSEYLANAVQKRYVEGIQSDKLRALNDRYSILIKQIEQALDIVDRKVEAAIAGTDSSDDAVVALIAAQSKLKLATSAEKIEREATKLKSLMNTIFSKAGGLSQLSGTNRMKAMSELADVLSTLPGIAAEMRQVKHTIAGIKTLRDKHRLPIVPVAQSMLEFGPDTTEQGEVIPNAAKATLKMYLFNYQPFSMGFEYKDYKGDPTFDVNQCPFYQDYVTKRFLRPGYGLGLRQPSFTTQGDRPVGEFNPNFEGMLGFRFPTTVLERVPTDDRTDRYINPVREVITTKHLSLFPSKFTVPLIELKTGNFINMHEDIVYEKDDTNFILVAISVRLENKLAMQPIQGSLHPTFQYMGGVNAKVSLISHIVGSEDSPQHTHDQVLRKLHYMKAESEAVALKNARMRRHHKIFIANNWANIAGIQAVQLLTSSVATSPNGPAQSQVRMEFVEFRASQESREMLLNDQPYSTEEVRLALRFATDYYKEKQEEDYIRVKTRHKTLGLVMFDEENTLYQVVGWHLYGGGVPTGFKALDGKSRSELEELYNKGVLGLGKVPFSETVQVVVPSEYLPGGGRRQVISGTPLYSKVLRTATIKFPHGYERVFMYQTGVRAGKLPTATVVVTGVGRVYYWKEISPDWDSTEVPGILSTDTVTAALLRDPDYADKLEFNLPPMLSIGTISSQAIDNLTKSSEYKALTLLGGWRGKRVRDHTAIGHVKKRFRSEDKYVGWECGKVTDTFIDLFVDTVMSQEVAYDPVLSAIKDADKPFVPYRIDPATNLRERILKMSRWMAKHIPEYKLLMARLHKQARDRSTYPDLALPTFEDAFKPVFDALDKECGYKENFSDYSAAAKAFITKFVPTYQDLGLPPPMGSTRLDPARTRKDLVDPDFYWYYQRMGDQMEEALQIAKDDLRDPGTSGYTFGGKVAQRAINDDTGASSKALQLKRGQPRISAVGSNFDLARSPAKRDSDHKDYEHDYTPVLKAQSSKHRNKRNDVANVIESFDPLSAKYNIALARKTMEATADDRWRMSKCYPTFQLYFLERDAEQWGQLDDTFGYLAVNEIRIRKEKFLPAVADITLINISGNLDESMAGSIAAKRYKFEGTTWVDSIIGPAASIIAGDSWDDMFEGSKVSLSSMAKSKTAPEDATEPFTKEDKYLDHFFLGPGTMIAIKKGYSSKPDELETVFTGQIVELERGDIIHLVAQDYSIELTVPIDKDLKGVGVFDWLPFIKNKKSGAAPQVIKTIFDKSPTDHYGKFDLMSVFADVAGTANDRFGGLPDVWGRRRRYPGDDDRDPNFFQGIRSGLAELHSTMMDYTEKRDRKMENIFYTEQPWLYNLLAGERWVIAHKTGLETLHELTRHNPGWVFATRPYDLNGATLYFGKTSGFYYYTAAGRVEERKWYEGEDRKKLQDEARKGIRRLLMTYLATSDYDAYMDFTTYVAFAEKKEDDWRSLTDPAAPLPSPAELSKVRDSLKGYCGKEGSSVSAIPSLERVEGIIGSSGLRGLARWFFNRAVYGSGGGVFDAIEWGFTRGMWTASGGWDAPGSVLMSLREWRESLDYISAEQKVSKKGVRPLKHLLLGSDPNPSLYDMTPIGRKQAKTTTESGHTIDNNAYKDAVEYVVRKQRDWKAFIHTFADFLSGDSYDLENTRALACVALEYEPYLFPPRTRPFRKYHSADASSDIINNGIRASRDQMANYVIVHYPNSIKVVETTKAEQNTWGDSAKAIQFAQDQALKKFVIPYCELTKDERIVRTVTEKNADNIVKAELCAYSNLAEAMRPMYRGELVLRGNERIDPWDIITIFDAYNDMHGHIEVEAVVHHFTYETGFVSSVTPHAVVIPNSHSDYWHCLKSGLWTGIRGFAGQLTLGIGGLALLGRGPLLSGTIAGAALILGAWKGIPAIVEGTTGATIWGNVVGRGRYGMRNYPVHMLPLVVSGLPYLVGLQKLGPRGFSVRSGQRWRRFTRGIVGAAYNMADRVVTGVSDTGAGL